VASPTEAELEAQIAAVHDLENTILQAQTLQTEYDALVALVEADNADEILSTARTFVLEFDASFPVAIGMILRAWIAYNRHLALGVSTDPAALFQEVYQYLHDNSGSIESRVFSNGSVSMNGGNTGNGTIRRVLFDPKGYAIQNRHAQVVYFRVRTDANLGADRHGALFEVKGTGRNALGTYLPFKSASTQGSGGSENMEAHNASRAGNLIRNGSFDNWTIAGGQPVASTPAALASGDTADDWTINTATNVTADVDTLYREEPGVTRSAKAVLETNVLFTQEWDAFGISAVAGVCYWAQAAARRRSTADGTLTFRVGALTFSVDVTTLTDDVWTLVVPTADENLYGENLSETGATNEVQLASNTTGDVEVDSFMACPMDEFDAIPYAPVSGSTDFLHDDRGQFTDTLSAEGIVGRGLFQYFGVMLPHNATPTIPDPT